MILKIKSLKEHSGFVKYFKNTSWLFTEKMLRMSVGLFVGIWVARYLGPEQFGLFSYAQSFVGLFATIATFGLDGIIIRELVKDDSKRGILLGTAFILKLIGAFLVLTTLAIAINFTSNDKQTNILIFIIASAIVFQSFNVIDFYFQSQVLSKYVVFANIISLLLSSIIKIVLILNEASLIYFAYIITFDSFVLAMGFLYFYFHNSLSFGDWQFDITKAKELLKDSWPLLFSSGVLMIQARVDQVMLKEMTNSAEVGYYSVALKLIETFGFIPILLKSSLLPSIINAKNASVDLYLDRLLNFYRLIFLCFLFTAVPIFLFSEQLIVLLFGIEYQNAGILLSLMAIRLFFTDMGVARGIYILAENLFKFSLITMILGTITNIVLNYILINLYGTQGAIVSTIVSFFVTVFLIDLFYLKTSSNVLLMLKSIFTFYRLRLDK
ncbi:MAG: flippase [Deltaproteobacteria bacterium]|nr:flippase [Deltaproteobacteria bacterium]